MAGEPQRPEPLRQAGSRALSHLSGCRAVPARAGGAGGVGGTGASRPARQTAPAAAADLHRPGAVRTAGDQRICQEMGGGVAVQEPQARLWLEGGLAAVASGADALGHRTGGRICDPADAGLYRLGAPGRSGPARPAPWRAPGTRTAGLIQAGIARILREVGRSAFIAAIWGKIDAAASSTSGSSAPLADKAA